MNVKIILLILLALCTIVSCKKKEVVVPAPAPVIVKDTVKKAPVVVEEKKPVRNIVQNYFLIAGCFEYEENATKLVAKLQKEGYDSRIVPYYENLYLVSYNGFPTEKEALDALEEMHKEKDKKAVWVYKGKK